MVNIFLHALLDLVLMDRVRHAGPSRSLDLQFHFHIAALAHYPQLSHVGSKLAAKTAKDFAKNASTPIGIPSPKPYSIFGIARAPACDQNDAIRDVEGACTPEPDFW